MRPRDACAAKPSRQGVDQPVDIGRADVKVGGGADPSGARGGDDVLPAEEAHGFGGRSARFAEGDDASAVLRRARVEEFVSFGLDAGGNAIAEVLDNRGYFSLPYFK